MLRYIARRSLQAVPLLFLISVLVFALIHAAPGGPLEMYLANPNVRPEDIEPAEAGEFTGEVVLTEPLGVETVVHIRNGQQTFLSTQSGMTAWRIGDEVRFDIIRERLHFFDDDEMRI